MTRHEYGHTCPLGFAARKREHVWIETTSLRDDTERRFSCDLCTAIATENFARIGGEA